MYTYVYFHEVLQDLLPGILDRDCLITCNSPSIQIIATRYMLNIGGLVEIKRQESFIQS